MGQTSTKNCKFYGMYEQNEIKSEYQVFVREYMIK
jgi:hypothetical protein